MNKKLLVINAVGLTESLISSATPRLKSFLEEGSLSYLKAPYPAVTCTSQANMLTGKDPSEHGIVANGWYFRELSQVWLWRQSNHLIQAPKVWDHLKEIYPDFTTAKMFWWFNMYSTAQWSMTPRPIYRSDGSKYPHAYAEPASLNERIKKKLGDFPLFKFWGPLTDISSTEWIAEATIDVMKAEKPNLALTYLPHLDYNLQRIGHSNPAIKKDCAELDAVIGKLLDCAKAQNYQTIIVSEYGIQDVDQPIHINRILRNEGYIKTTLEMGEEHPDVGACNAFAVADHQIAHVYIKNKEDIHTIKSKLSKESGIDQILDKEEQKQYNIDHERSGELVLLAKPNAWFTYYYWLDDNKAPDFSRTVDIHKKPGYDPVELFMIPGGKIKAAITLLKKKLGLRYLLNVIPLDAKLVKGSHGVPPKNKEDGPLLLTNKEMSQAQDIDMKDIYTVIKKYYTD